MSEYNMTHTGKELDDAIAKVQSSYVSFSHYYPETYTPRGTSLEKTKTFTCGFKPKVILVLLSQNKTASTYGLLAAFRANIDGVTSVGTGLYKHSNTNGIDKWGGGISVSNLTSTGFTISHGTIGLMPGASYNVHVWG